MGMFVLMMGIGTNIQVKADTLRQVKSIKTKTTYKYYKGIVNAKDMRKKKIASLRKQIEKLEKLSFNE